MTSSMLDFTKNSIDSLSSPSAHLTDSQSIAWRGGGGHLLGVGGGGGGGGDGVGGGVQPL